MTQRLKALTKAVLILSVVVFPLAAARAQGGVVILEGAQLTHVVPTSYYFEGQSAPTQMRNTAAAKFGNDRYLIVGLVDTSGYSSDVRAKYQGFFITDSPVNVGGQQLGTGAYGFGFTDDGHLNILDLGGRQVLSAPTKKDTEIKRPRPIMFTADAGGIRFYSGRDYAVISFR